MSSVQLSWIRTSHSIYWVHMIGFGTHTHTQTIMNDYYTFWSSSACVRLIRGQLCSAVRPNKSTLHKLKWIIINNNQIIINKMQYNNNNKVQIFIRIGRATAFSTQFYDIELFWFKFWVDYSNNFQSVLSSKTGWNGLRLSFKIIFGSQTSMHPYVVSPCFHNSALPTTQNISKVSTDFVDGKFWFWLQQ